MLYHGDPYYNHLYSLPRGGVLTRKKQLIYPDGKTAENGLSMPWDIGETNTFMHCPGFLGTICNLPEPVTKTADKTMKITYTLREAGYDPIEGQKVVNRMVM